MSESIIFFRRLIMSKMKKCKTCGQPIAKSAKICPNCGAKNKKSRITGWLFLLIIAVIIFVIVNNDNDKDKDYDKDYSHILNSETQLSRETTVSSEKTTDTPSVEITDTVTVDIVTTVETIVTPAESEDEFTDELRPDFKAAMDNYETYMQKYCNFMKNYNPNSMDINYLSEYSALMQEYYEMTKAFEAWESEDLNNAELKYYLEVTNRVTQMLLEVQ